MVMVRSSSSTASVEPPSPTVRGKPEETSRGSVLSDPRTSDSTLSCSTSIVPKRKLEWSLRERGKDSRNDKLAMLYNNPRYADARLIPQLVAEVAADGRAPERQNQTCFYAQRAVLASWSPVFDSIFYGEHPETFGEHYHQDGEVHVDSPSEVIDLFLTYIYKGDVILTINNLWPLYCFVNTYQIQSLVDTIEDVMDKAVTIDTCCSLLASAAVLGSYDHYALRKCLNMLLMDFAEIIETPDFLQLDYEVLRAIISSDELNASEECVFEGVMKWVTSDEQRVGLHLDDLLSDIRFPLMDTKFVASLDSHPIASKSRKLPMLMLEALKFAVAPKEVLSAGKMSFHQRKGGLYWKTTKNNMCLDIGSNHFKTFVLNCACNLMESWKLAIELFEDGAYVVGVATEDCDTDFYVGRYKDGWGLAHNGHFYAGGCKCDPGVKHLCTPLCQGHMRLASSETSVISICYEPHTCDLIFRTGQKLFTQRLQGVNDRRLFPAVSLKNAKIRIFKENAELFE